MKISSPKHIFASARPCDRWYRLHSAVIASLVVLLGAAVQIEGQSLQVTYGGRGLQTLSWSGTTLADIGAYPGDAFHIWHMKSTDLQGNVIPGWGENNNGEVWNAAAKTMTYNFSWGTISTHFAQTGDNLDLIVTESSNAGSNIILDGAELYPLTLHFPQDPAGFSGYSQFLITTTGPAVSAAEFGSGIVTSVLPDESVAMYGGWKNLGANTYSPIMAGTAPDGLPPFLPRNDKPVSPGTSFTYTVSLRFTSEGTPASAADAYSSFAATYPSQMTWTDKRIIGTAYLASSPANNGDSTQPGGFPTNPRRYFNDPTVDITSSVGLQAFQNRILAQALQNVSTAQALNSQGVITWDVEGEQYPQATSYVCSPDQVAAVAPEMESTVSDRSSSYFGLKLDDAYFKTMTSAGLKVGLCLRPQVFTVAGNGTASQGFLSTNAAIAANLENKARFANARWGATIFYVDSTVDVTGGTLDPAIFQQLITDLPSFLFIPEESTPRYYAYSAPFYTFIFHTDLGTPAAISNVYPHAFGANLVNDVSAGTLAKYTPQLIQSVANGDILMGHADYWQANDPTLVSIYQAAGASALPPLQVSPSINWPAPAPIVFGTPLSATQLNASANTVGRFVFTPSAGTILGAGTQSLLAIFTPSDTKDYTSATASVNLSVAQADPGLTWSTPAPIPSGTALSGTQLDATASVPGTFAYTPAAGTVLSNGNRLLQVTFTPSDATDYKSSAASVNLTVNAPAAPQTPVISWSTPASIVYGAPLGNSQLNAASNVPGTFSYSPGVNTLLNAGSNTLRVTFTPSDTANYNSVSASVTLTVSRANPSLTWAQPQGIVYGTTLSGQQLNAAASVSGNFTYTPAASTLLSAGNNTLQVSFTPSDSNDFNSISSSVNLNVAQATPILTWSQPASIPYGIPLSGNQLNPTANVAGSFTYNPASGTIPQAGTQTLAATFTPSDGHDYIAATISVPLTVLAAPPPPSSAKLGITSPSAGATVSGLITVLGQCSLALDSAGTYLMVDGIEVGRRVGDRPYVYPLDTTTLSNGPHTLQLWGHDIGNNTTLSVIIPVTVAN